MVAYILSLAQDTSAASLPPRGGYTPPDSAASSNSGAVVLRAAYTDRGANGILGAAAETTVVLRAPTVVVATGELSAGVEKEEVDGIPFDVAVARRSGGFARLEAIDLTGISAVVLTMGAPAPHGATGGKVEVRVDSASGTLVGETEVLRPTPDSAGPPARMRATLTPTAGVHDVYLVFRGDGASAGQLLFGVLTATFEPAAAPGPSQGPDASSGSHEDARPKRARVAPGGGRS
jgi:cytochrome c